MQIKIPYTNLSDIITREYVFVSRCKKRNEKRIETYRRMISELETENLYYDTKMEILKNKRMELIGGNNDDGE